MDGVSAQQLETCDRFGVTPVPVPSDEKVGIALNVRDGARPVNAVRHLPVGDTTGWYLALPPGHGVIVEPGYEDVWFDPALLVE